MSVLYFSDVCRTARNASTHHRLEPVVHFGFGPEVAVAILHPLEIRRRDTAGVGENVGDHEDAPLVQMPVRFRRGRSVRSLRHDPRP